LVDELRDNMPALPARPDSDTVFIGSYVCSTLLSEAPHGDALFFNMTSRGLSPELSNMIGTQKKPGGFRRPAQLLTGCYVT
jgi:hypothetical protein